MRLAKRSVTRTPVQKPYCPHCDKLVAVNETGRVEGTDGINVKYRCGGCGCEWTDRWERDGSDPSWKENI